MPTARKPPGRRQRRNDDSVGLVVVDGEFGEVPDADPAWLDEVEGQWVQFWQSPIATQVQDSDRPALRRLFRLYDEIERMWTAVEETGRVVEGSQGQPRPNPLLKSIEGLQSEVRQLEDRFGLSPKARLNLGVTFAEAHRGLDALNDRLARTVQEQEDPFDDDVEEGSA